MNVQTFDNYYVIKNVLTDTQISTLINWWNNKSYQTEVLSYNSWDNTLNKKQKIISKGRNTEIIGIPLNTFDFLDTIYNNIFTAVHGSSLTLEGPNYFNKYPTGGFHDQHNDIVKKYPDRKYICTLQLSDTSTYTGGDLQIHKYICDEYSTPEYMTAPKDKGCAIVYNNKAVHKVTEITSGIRYAIMECAG